MGDVPPVLDFFDIFSDKDFAVSAVSEQHMAYLGFQKIIPMPALRPFVQSFWWLHREQSLTHYSEEFLHPGGGFGIVFNFGDAIRLDGLPMSDRVFLDGTNTVSRKMGFEGTIDQIGIRFHPGGAYPFLGVPLKMLVNAVPLLEVSERLPLIALWRSGIEVSKIEWKDGQTTPQPNR